MSNLKERKFIEGNGKYYENLKEIGRTKFAIVYKANIKGTNEKRAIKVYKMNEIKKELLRKSLKTPTDEEINIYFNDTIWNEVKNMEIVEGKNKENDFTVKLYDYFEQENEIFIIMELCDENFSNYFAQKNALTPKKIHEILNHLNHSFKIMAEENLVHRALNLQNILIQYIDKEKTKYMIKLKLTEDSILLNDLLNCEKSKRLNGNLKYFAPEVLSGGKYNEKCDLWSLGIIIYELYFKNPPFNGEGEMDLLNDINDNIKTFSNKLNICKDPDLDDLIHKLININVKKRYDWNQYFKHPFFRKRENCSKFYKLIEEKGSTKFAKIYKAKSIENPNSEFKAIKIYDKDQIRSYVKTRINRNPTDEDMKPYFDSLYREMELMMMIQGKNNENENSVKIFEYFDNDKEFSLVMELCDNNLLGVLNKNFSSEDILDLLNQLNNSFRFMFENDIIHRALNLENILIKYSDNEKSKYIYKLKLTNDSCLLKNSNDKNLGQINGLINYIPPELLKREKCSINSDLWSLGIIIYALYFREFPYTSDWENGLIKEIERNKDNFKKAEDSILDDLIRKLLKPKTNERLTWEQYFNHRFFEVIKKDYERNYEKVSNIGYTDYALVIKAKARGSNEYRAIKIYDKNKIKNKLKGSLLGAPTEKDIEPEMKKINNEIENMKLIEGNNNINSVKFYESFDNEKELAIVMELCDENLLNNLTKRNKPFNPDEICNILRQLNNSFKIISEKKLVHRAINLENVLIKNTNEGNPIFKLKLTEDSILLKDIKNEKKFSINNVNKNYFAPEILEKKDYNEKCDLWSLGILIYVLSFQEFPYQGDYEEEILNNIKKIKQNFKRTSNEKLDELIKNLLKADLNERYGWNKYFAHPFFNSQNSTNVY